MADTAQAAVPVPPRQSPAAAVTRDGFYFWTATLLFALLLVGFAPTFFLRIAFGGPPVAAHLHVHGAVLTAWYAWLLLQTTMVRYGRVDTHRRLGLAGAALGAAVVVAGPLATFGLVPSLQAAGLDWTTDMSALPRFGIDGMPMAQFAGMVVFGNLANITSFAILFAAAIGFRRNAETHKRLMIIAAITLFPPVLARISRWTVLGGEDGPFIPLALLALLVAVVAHDVVTTRRVHKATLSGVGLVIAVVVAAQALAGSEFGAVFIRSLGQASAL